MISDSSGQSFNSFNSVSAKVHRGLLGEELVAKWLQQQGCQILEKRWRCRWGELDIIALATSTFKENLSSSCPILIFVEVKTRSYGNWDRDGLLAITEAKQAKLWQTAEMFLGDRPELTNYPCRFDVALVKCISSRWDISQTRILSPQEQLSNLTIKLGHPILVGSDRLILQDYIPSAFVNEL
jgi:putative endonuclease